MKNLRHSTTFLVTTALLLFGTGCASHEGAYEAAGLQAPAVENRAKFVLLDAATRDSVDCSSLQEQTLADGRLEVVANIRNRLNRRIEVQVNCVFKNEQGFATKDDAPFRTLILTENAQESVRFVSANGDARTYTIRVRQSR